MSPPAPRPVSFTGSEGNRLAGDLYEAATPEGPPVLLVHGGGQTRHAWERTAHRLAAAGLTALTLDQRGHGESDWLESGHYRFRDYAADLGAVARAIALRHGARPVAIGASLGGIASTLAQGEDPDTLQGLVLVDIVPRMDPGGVSRITGFMAERMHEGFGSVEEAAEAVAEYLPNRKRPPSVAGLRKNLRLHEDGRYRWHWDPRFLSGPFNVGAGREQDLARMEAALRSLTIPVMLVRGGNSELVPEDSVRHFMELIPHAEYRDVSGAGHMVAGDRNDQFADAALEFLHGLAVRQR